VKVSDLIPLVKKPQCHEDEVGTFLRSILFVHERGIPGVMVEIGTNKGKSLVCLLQAMGHQNSRRAVYCIDPYENAQHYFQHRVDKFAGAIPVEHIRLCSQDPEAARQVEEQIAWLFLDGCHCYDCVLKDLDLWVPKVIRGGVVVLHDFCPRYNYKKRDFCASGGMARLWGVWPAFKMSKAARNLQLVDASPRNTPGMSVFRKE